MLHRSTSSRRSRASRNMTNFGHTSPIAGPRGRRASVATDKPVDLPPTSLRGTMERQRSPRGSIVPDIALSMGNDIEVVHNWQFYLFIFIPSHPVNLHEQLDSYESYERANDKTSWCIAQYGSFKHEVICKYFTWIGDEKVENLNRYRHTTSNAYRHLNVTEHGFETFEKSAKLVVEKIYS